MLILDLADDLFDQILDGDKPVHAAIFIDDQRHVDALLLHLLQKHTDGHRGGHIKQRPQHRAQGEFDRSLGAKAVFQRQILKMDQPQWAVQRASKHRDTGKTVFAEHLDQFRKGGGHRSGDDFHLGHRNVIDAHAAQIDHAENTGRGCGRPLVTGLGAIRFGLATAECAKNAPQKAA